MNGYRINTIINTGAGVSVVTSSLACQIGTGLFPWEGHSVILANGEDLKPEWGIRFTIAEPGKEEEPVEISAIVLPFGGANLLLGNDVLKPMGAQINYPSGGPPEVSSNSNGRMRNALYPQ